ncbi:MAG: hypothetical protein PHF64_02700 [Methanoregula sp.]|nr:hypothetical protein [Methanoregula sp.]
MPDTGCGTGEHALFFAENGFEVWGIDTVPRRSGKRRREYLNAISASGYWS